MDGYRERKELRRRAEKAGRCYDEDGVVYKISSARMLENEGVEEDPRLDGKNSTLGEMIGAV